MDRRSLLRADSEDDLLRQQASDGRRCELTGSAGGHACVPRARPRRKSSYQEARRLQRQQPPASLGGQRRPAPQQKQLEQSRMGLVASHQAHQSLPPGTHMAEVRTADPHAASASTKECPALCGRWHGPRVCQLYCQTVRASLHSCVFSSTCFVLALRVLQMWWSCLMAATC